MAQKLNVGLISLGCDKNRIDAEQMLGILNDRGYNIVNDERIADIIIINTCCFIESAKQESIDSILQILKNKSDGSCRFVIVSGCLAERYGEELLSEIPEIDAVVGVGNYMDIDLIVKSLIDGKKNINITNNINYSLDFKSRRILTTPSYMAYVKIAEGCSNNCSYCIIPKIRGKYRSRSIESIVSEVNVLSSSGTKEIILVAQDTSKYGIDLYGKKMLTKLISEISKIAGVEWIRLLYCYPEGIDDELINEMSQNEKLCKYIDIPIQHINDNILKRMKRMSSKENIENLINLIRRRIPDIIIRTSIIVGFPGETDQQFNELYNFLNIYKLDRVGVFTYSCEEGTEAALFDEQIDENTKKQRQKKLMMLQKNIFYENNKNKIGKVFKVIIEDIKNDGVITGRTYGDAPGIDGIVYVKKEDKVNIGDFVNVRVTNALNYDLVGEIDYESCK